MALCMVICEKIPVSFYYDSYLAIKMSFIIIEDIPWVLKLKIASNIADALHFLHSQTPKILHRDLKSPNVLVSFHPFSFYINIFF